MSYLSCIRHPKKSRYYQLHEWMVLICQNNHCAALILTHFIAWHDWKLLHDAYYKRSNDIAEKHGDGRPHEQNAYLFFSVEDLSDGMFGAYGKNSIKQAVEFLAKLGLISIHKNPNPRYHFDKTKYFRFYPEVCNEWIEKNYAKTKHTQKNNFQVIDNNDNLKKADRSTINGLPLARNKLPSSKIGEAITDTTNNTTTNNNQIINADENITLKYEKNNFVNEAKESAQSIVDALVGHGLPVDKFKLPDVLPIIERLNEAGASIEMFIKAYAISTRVTNGCGFGINYLTKVVESLLVKSQKAIKKENKDIWYPNNSNEKSSSTSKKQYHEDLKNAESWAADLL